jgi:Zn-dependent protease
MIILFICIIFFSAAVHEYAHGWMAVKLGDPTAKLSGRLSLNPLVHIDILGTIILPLVFILLSRGNIAFGYAKPMPINPYHFKNPKKALMLIGLSGPAINLLLVGLLILLKRLLLWDMIQETLTWTITINLILAIFNLLPIPPLDGSRIIAAFLPYKIFNHYIKLEKMGLILIFVLLLSGFFHWGVLPITQSLLNIFGVKDYF